MSVLLKKMTAGFALIAAIALFVGLYLPENREMEHDFGRESQWMQRLIHDGASERFLTILKGADRAVLYSTNGTLDPLSASRWRLSEPIRELSGDELSFVKAELTNQELYYVKFQGKGIYVPNYVLRIYQGNTEIFISWSEQSDELELGDAKSSFVLKAPFALKGGSSCAG